MTGYGISTVETPGYVVRTEIKTLNSKFFELKLKLPYNFLEKEQEMRNNLEAGLSRGKAEVSVIIRYVGLPKYRKDLNNELAKAYFAQISDLCKELNVKTPDSIEPVLSLPDVFNSGSGMEEIDEDEWNNVLICLGEAITKTDEFRLSEGSRLEKEIAGYLEIIEKLNNEINFSREERVEKTRSKLYSRLTELNTEINPERFEQEMVYYLEKLDITEEIDRLKSHIAYFRNTMNEQECGRKLGFIVQEMGREINTIGSKANDFGIQQKVVMMKNELEKIRQQLANIL